MRPRLTGVLSQMCNLLFRKEELKKPWNVRVCMLCSAARDCIHKGTLDLVPDPSILAIHPRLCLYDGYTGNSSDLTKSDVLVRPRRWERLGVAGMPGGIFAGQARYFSKKAEQKIKEAGGACILTA